MSRFEGVRLYRISSEVSRGISGITDRFDPSFPPFCVPSQHGYRGSRCGESLCQRAAEHPGGADDDGDFTFEGKQGCTHGWEKAERRTAKRRLLGKRSPAGTVVSCTGCRLATFSSLPNARF